MASPPAVMQEFDDVLSDWLVKSCHIMGIRHPTPIQQNCVPPILQGRDVIAAAQTGSGKTAAFALPILESLAAEPYGVYALVLTPTRELAFQISDQFKALGAPLSLKVSVVIGGVDIINQGLELQRRPHVIIATPGRLAYHIKGGSPPYLKKVKYLVLDEADRLLEPSFTSALATIIAALPETRQTLMFSATMTEQVKGLCDSLGEDTFQFDTNPRVTTVETLSQRYLFIPPKVKETYLYYFLTHDDVGWEDMTKDSVIIFTATCKGCQQLTETLRLLGIECVPLHSILTQAQRTASLSQFKAEKVRVLVTTDVGSRGLDIPQVDLVVNYDVPQQSADYIHRVGRTARAGRYGSALTLITQHDIERIHNIEARINTKLEELELEEERVLKRLTKVSKAKRTAALALIDKRFGEDRAARKAEERERRQQREGGGGGGGDRKRRKGEKGHKVAKKKKKKKEKEEA
eukprot:TRINITY_DN432_c1_g1_i8.p1 TRINITY_DN432_c1_g1~~TRINITY_DN432_c1_g1_i8.p1  ORF type:complete len:463 (+),score=115.50 TRINITY_DN432_c1_g1_i8:324-1712(+)